MQRPRCRPLSSAVTARCAPKVVVRDSLTGNTSPLAVQPTGEVTWYACGPTVYDSAHLGHARTYVSFDIIRRILEDHFGYRLNYAMGVTDVDDKIIRRAAERDESPRDLARRFEAEFMEDMRVLNVRPPSRRLRVTEHIPEIVNFTRRVIENGYAYEANGGDVYFDVDRFEGDGYKYGQFRELQGAAQWEGSSAPDAETSPKKNLADFALWKGYKPGIDHNDCTWDAPWGRGRPGWHIECSAMVQSQFGDHLSLHTGGVDLQFPHHNNEMAQCSGYLCRHEWVGAWLHSGHLNIEGLKMSKSLKNFITIRDFLNDFSPDELRMFCLQHHYAAGIDFTQQGLLRARAALEKFGELGDRLAYLEDRGEADNPIGTSSFTSSDEPVEASEFRQRIANVRGAISSSLADDFDTPRALLSLTELATDTQKHLTWLAMQNVGSELWISQANEDARAAWALIESTLGMLGVRKRHQARGRSRKSGPRNQDSLAIAEVIAECRSRVRDSLSTAAPESLSQKARSAIFQWCDQGRDTLLPLLEAKLDDMPDGSFKIRAWTATHQEQARAAEAARCAEAAEGESKRQRAELPPSEMFKGDPEYSRFDERGIPTHGSDGEPLSKRARKKVEKKYNKRVERLEKRREG